MGVSVEEIPAFDSFNADMGGLYQERLQKIEKYGYGIFSSFGMFRLSDDKEIEPIVSADKIAVQSFIGYEEQREKVVANTRAFVEGRPAANTLLCGDAGTGKSSTVKAVANMFFDEGVRLIELRKDQLRFLPFVMGKVSGNPLKFIIFIDDLSFNQNDDNFSMLKAALEGSASAKADNAVIYATSNRRHIIKESFGDREGDDVHVNDTLQETLSLSERFGLTVLYSKPDKKLYLEIVRQLAERFGVTMDVKELEIKAEEFALRKGNRSARCAEQFINSLL
jgi:predicted AAA+ superfamily ATPase